MPETFWTLSKTVSSTEATKKNSKKEADENKKTLRTKRSSVSNATLIRISSKREEIKKAGCLS